MTQVQITEEQFTKAMHEAVAERGENWVYPSLPEEEEREGLATEWRSESGLCRYSKSNGEPACIIGLALHKIDPSLVPPANNFNSASTVLSGKGLPRSVTFAAQHAQAAQDSGRPWGQALAEYEAYLNSQRN